MLTTTNGEIRTELSPNGGNKYAFTVLWDKGLNGLSLVEQGQQKCCNCKGVKSFSTRQVKEKIKPKNTLKNHLIELEGVFRRPAIQCRAADTPLSADRVLNVYTVIMAVYVGVYVCMYVCLYKGMRTYVYIHQELTN